MMLKIIKSGILVFALAAAFVPLPALNAQKTPENPTAPVPAQILSAKKVFISNGGVNGNSRVILFLKMLDFNQPYNQFYAAIKNWGRFELVTAPADADLVFRIRFTLPFSNDVDSQLDLAILDAKTHFRLWTITQPIQLANRQETRIKNFSQAMADLVDSIKILTAPPLAGTQHAR
jgi:hypothetical protein